MLAQDEDILKGHSVFSLCEIVRDKGPAGFQHQEAYHKWRAFSFTQGWSKPGQLCRVCPRLFFLHYSPNWFIYTGHDSRWIMVALCCGRMWSHLLSARWSGPCVMDLLWRWRYLLCLTVIVCLMFPGLLVWTETNLHHVELCVISDCNIKGFLRREARLWQRVWKAQWWYVIMIWWSNREISKLSPVESSFRKICKCFLIYRCFLRLFSQFPGNRWKWYPVF